MIVLIPILVAIIGALVHCLATNQKYAQLGFGAFVVGLFFAVAPYAGQATSLFGK
jgi:hypothetical protein